MKPRPFPLTEPTRLSKIEFLSTCSSHGQASTGCSKYKAVIKKEQANIFKASKLVKIESNGLGAELCASEQTLNRRAVDFNRGSAGELKPAVFYPASEGHQGIAWDSVLIPKDF